MIPPAIKTVILSCDKDDSPPPSLRRVVRNSALLNVVIVLTAAPVLVFTGGLKAVVPTLAIMAGISVLIWTATFALFSFASVARILWTPVPTKICVDPVLSSEEPGIADRWLDGPG
jgi:hypothetical protein